MYATQDSSECGGRDTQRTERTHPSILDQLLRQIQKSVFNLADDDEQSIRGHTCTRNPHDRLPHVDTQCIREHAAACVDACPNQGSWEPRAPHALEARSTNTPGRSDASAPSAAGRAARTQHAQSRRRGGRGEGEAREAQASRMKRRLGRFIRNLQKPKETSVLPLAWKSSPRGLPRAGATSCA